MYLFQAKLQCAHSGAKEWTATVSEGLAFVEEGYSLLPRLCTPSGLKLYKVLIILDRF
jgi:hypothetical protein